MIKIDIERYFFYGILGLMVVAVVSVIFVSVVAFLMI